MEKVGKILALFTIVLFMISFLSITVSAVFDITIKGPLADPVDTTTWYGAIMDFFGFGETWAQALVSIFMFIIIMAALYDILGTMAFLRSPYVRVLIGIGVAGIASIVGAVRAISGLAFTAAGVVSGIGIAAVIIIAIVAWMLVHFGFSWLATRMIRSRGEVEAEEAAAEAKKKAAAVRGAGAGLTGTRG